MSQHFRFILPLALLTLVSLGRVCGNDFVDVDDNLYVTENPHVRAGLSAEGIHWAFTTTRANFWHPITWLSLQLDATLFGADEAWGFHLTNLLLHLANVLLLYGVLAAMTQQPWPSFWVAALFAVHPLHVESVAWVAERKDVLSTMFWLLAMGAYAHFADRPRWPRMLLVVLPLALGLMVKPMLVTFPFTLLLLDVWPLRRWPGVSPLRLVAEKLPLFLLAFAASAWTFSLKRELGEVVLMPFGDRLANAVISYGWYLQKTFLPVRLGVFYTHPFAEWSPIEVAVSGLALAAITTVCVLMARRHRCLLIGWLWFLGTLVPVIGLVQVGEQARADRFVYVPHIGLFMAVVWSAAALVSRWRWSAESARAAGGLVVGTLAVLTCVQAGHWKDAPTLWRHTISVTEGNHRALAVLGVWYAKQTDPQALQQAADCLSESVRLREGVPDNHYNLGVVLDRLGHRSEAMAHYRRTLELDPHFADARHNLAYMLLLEGKGDQAIDHFNEVLRQKPDAEDTHLDLGLALRQKGQLDDALTHFRRALEIRPNYVQAHNQVGFVELSKGHAAEAEGHFRRALKLNADYALAANGLGLALARQERWEEAVSTLKRVAFHHPRYLRNLAYALYQKGDRGAARDLYARLTFDSPQWPAEAAAEALGLAAHDPQDALEQAMQACQATGFRDPRLLDVLAIVQAARGDFEAARKTAADALARTQADPDLARQIEMRLRLYEKGRPAPPP